MLSNQSFVVGLFLFIYNRPQHQKNTEGPTLQAQNPINWKPQPPNPLQNPNPPQMSKNEKKYEE